MPADQFTCTNCGEKFQSNPHVERMLLGHVEFSETSGLCWVCKRLKCSVMQEAKAMQETFKNTKAEDLA